MDIEALKHQLRGDVSTSKRHTHFVWPTGETMLTLSLLNNLERCVSDVLARGVPGDLIETGVWRGGACIFMRALLDHHGDPDRLVWVADSFCGLPPPNSLKYPADAGMDLSNVQGLAVSLEQVQANFAKYGMLDDRVRFLKGWFRDSLPPAPITTLAVMRLDGDLYESTMDALVHLYPKLSPGGYVIIDDWSRRGGSIPCVKAVLDYRAQHGIEDPIQVLDPEIHYAWGAFWQRGEKRRG